MSQEIDWTKPVEYFASSCEITTWPVVATEFLMGTRYAVVRYPDRLLVVHADTNLSRFRNVPVKVKYRAVWYVNLFANGECRMCPNREIADSNELLNWGKPVPRVECREIVIEWECEAE